MAENERPNQLDEDDVLGWLEAEKPSRFERETTDEFVHFYCSNGHRLRVSASSVGKQVRCPHSDCQALVIVPIEDERQVSESLDRSDEFHFKVNQRPFVGKARPCKVAVAGKELQIVPEGSKEVISIAQADARGHLRIHDFGFVLKQPGKKGVGYFVDPCEVERDQRIAKLAAWARGLRGKKAEAAVNTDLESGDTERCHECYQRKMKHGACVSCGQINWGWMTFKAVGFVLMILMGVGLGIVGLIESNWLFIFGGTVGACKCLWGVLTLVVAPIDKANDAKSRRRAKKVRNPEGDGVRT